MTNRTSGSWTGVFTLLLAVGVAVPVPGGVAAQPSEDPRTVEYALSFPALEHRWLQVDVVFPELDAAELTVRMSSSSPGRYARHEFAKNVIDVQVYDGSGAELSFERPSPHEWRVLGHDGTVHVRYRLFGDRVDGTYLAVDSTHAHMNMPATLMWAVGLEDRPARVRFEPPAGVSWRVATQLFPTADEMVFNAPNLQYLLDSPTELSEFELRTLRSPTRHRRPIVRSSASPYITRPPLAQSTRMWRRSRKSCVKP